MKAFIYCTQTKPFLYEGDTDKGPRYFSDNKDYKNDNPKLNGSIVAECEVKEAFKYDFVHRSGDSSNFYIRDQRTERMKDCLSNDDLFDYGKGKPLYAYHLENVRPVELKLSDFYEDEDCTKPLTKAPQSYRFAYRRHDCTDEEARMINYDCYSKEGHECFQDFYGWYYVEKCLILSDHAQYCAKILNGEKDLEVRKTRIAEGVTFK
jgi:hypothetical protein